LILFDHKKSIPAIQKTPLRFGYIAYKKLDNITKLTISPASIGGGHYLNSVVGYNPSLNSQCYALLALIKAKL
jgi:hypothetical protein